MGLLIKQDSPSYALPETLRVHGCPLTHRDTDRKLLCKPQSPSCSESEEAYYGHLPSHLSERTENCRHP